MKLIGGRYRKGDEDEERGRERERGGRRGDRRKEGRDKRVIEWM